MRSADVEVKGIAAATARERALLSATRRQPVEAGEDQLAALIALARTLTAADISYALIGGIAVGVHSGIPRATMDVDVAVASTVDRARIASVMTAAGFSSHGEFAHSLNFRHLSGEPVQIAIDPEFDAMIARAEDMGVAGVAVSIVRKDDLIEMNVRAAQDPAPRRSKALRDQADVALLRGDVPEPDEGW